MNARGTGWWVTALTAAAGVFVLAGVPLGAGASPSRDAAVKRIPPTFALQRSFVAPSGVDGMVVSCPRRTPHAISGLWLSLTGDVSSSGQLQLGDFFPSVNAKGTNARGWVIAVQNLSAERQEWIGGVVCSAVPPRYLFFTSKARPLDVDGHVLSCPRKAPYGASGFFLPDSETTGQVQLGDFFPSLAEGGAPYRTDGWVVAVKNLTDSTQGWLGGAVCTTARVGMGISAGTAAPLEVAAALSTCPRGLPYAVSGFFLVTTENAAELTGQLRVGDFLPAPGRRRAVGREWGVSLRNLTADPQDWISGATCMGPGRVHTSGELAHTSPELAHASEELAHAAKVGPWPPVPPSPNVLRRLCKKPWYRNQSDTHSRWCRRYR